MRSLMSVAKFLALCLRFGDVQIISNSSHYKLAGNSIVCDVLMYIYEGFMLNNQLNINK